MKKMGTYPYIRKPIFFTDFGSRVSFFHLGSCLFRNLDRLNDRFQFSDWALLHNDDLGFFYLECYTFY